MASKGKRNGSAAPASEESKPKVGRGAPRGDRPSSGGPGAGRGRGKTSSKDPNWIEIDDKKERAEFDNLRDQMTAVAEKYEKIEQAIKARNTEAEGWRKERADLRAQIKQTSQRLKQLLETKKQLRSQFQAANVEVRDIMEQVHTVKKKLPIRRLESERQAAAAGAAATSTTEAAPASTPAAAPAANNTGKKAKKGNAAPAAAETAPAAGGKKKKKATEATAEVTEPEGPAAKRRPGRKEKAAAEATTTESAEAEGDGKPKKTPEEREAEMRAKRERNFLIFQANMQYLDQNIKEMEHKLSTTSLSLADEKKTVREIQRLGALRREVSAVFDRLSKFRESDVKTVIFAEQREKDEEFSSLQDEIDTLRDKEQTIDARINDVYQTVLPDLRTKRDALGFEYEDLRKKKDEAWAAMQAVKDKFRDQIKAKQEQARVEREKERTERQERRRKYEDDKRVKEEKKVPYEDELELCDRLVQYLKPFLPKEEKKETTPASAEAGGAGGAAAEGARNKRRQQKSANENIKHQWDMFSLFEQLSLLPPTKVGEVEQSVSDIRAKRENYLKLQKEENERRQKEREEKERQEKERKEKEAAEAAAAAAASASAATTTTTEAGATTTSPAATESAETTAATTSSTTEEKSETKAEEGAAATPAVEEPKAEESH